MTIEATRIGRVWFFIIRDVDRAWRSRRDYVTECDALIAAHEWLRRRA